MPTINVRVIDPGGTGHYTNLAAWEAARQGNLVALDTIEKAECIRTAGTDTSQCVLTGWVTGPNNYIWIAGRFPLNDPSLEGPGGDRFRILGPVGATTAVIVATNFGGAGYLRIQSIQIQARNAVCSAIAHYTTQPGEVWISGCVLTHSLPSSGEGACGADLYGGNKKYLVWNNVAYNFAKATPPVNPNAGFHFQANSEAYCANNTVVGVSYGIIVKPTVRVWNNIVRDAILTGYNFGGFSAHPDSDYNIDDFGPVPGANSRIGYVSFSPPYRLDPADVVARRAGYPISAFTSPLAYADDWEGNIRTAMWDCGWDQITDEDHAQPDDMRVYDSKRWLRWRTG